jgi:hypothetical protein
VLLLGWLPLAYALGVWALLDWLLLGNPLYFLRSLAAHGGVFVRQAWPPPGALALTAALAALVALLLAAGMRRADGLLLALAALVAWGWHIFLRTASAAWVGDAAAPLALLLALAALGRLAQGMGGRGIYAAAILAPLVTVMALKEDRAASCAARPEQVWNNAELCRAVEADVRTRTPYGRVFVCGYEGLALLHDQPRGRLLPNLDLHIGELRRLYYGQTLFILIHRPIGRAAADSIHWRHPDSYRLGLERTLYERDFGGEWRLFKVVGAPTEEQLRAWRK